MRPSDLLRRTVLGLAIGLLAGCSDEAADRPAPRPMNEAADRTMAGEPAPAPLGDPSPDPGGDAEPSAPEAADPRMVLFDVKTALETARPTSGRYPPTEEFRGEERWRVQRERLDAAFDAWDYRAEGDSFELRGTIGERAWNVSGP